MPTLFDLHELAMMCSYIQLYEQATAEHPRGSCLQAQPLSFVHNPCTGSDKRCVADCTLLGSC